MELHLSDKKTLVLGSLNMDHNFYISHDPVNDLTYVPRNIIKTAGGHGGNCAVAIARAGGPVGLLSCVGNDEIGQFLLNDLKFEHVNTDFVIQKDGPSGTVYIPIFNNNYKYMIMDRGANDFISKTDIDFELLNREYSSLILFDQEREISLETMERFNRHNKLVFVVLCPASKLILSDFKEVGYPDFIIVNSEEAKLYPIDELSAHTNIIVTLGSNGVRAIIRGKAPIRIEGIKTNVCDTVGAGDCFVGLLNLFLLQGIKLSLALQLANKGAAISTTAAGARDGLPDLQRILQNMT